jgi:YesN/AraC family two-component response regulator
MMSEMMEKPEKNIETALACENFDRREQQWLHVPYEKELELLTFIKNGAVASVKESFFGVFPRHDGHLSRDARRQAIYEFIACVTLVTRFAVEGGLDIESAYSLSDAYIKSADQTKTREEVIALFERMAIDFTKKVKRAKQREKTVTPPVRKCIEYIDSNLHFKITLADLGRETERNPAYLCVKFKEEMDVSVTDYINTAKINEAKRVLLDSIVPLSEIANTLGFCTQSYFAKLFKEQTGETPKNYRINHFRTHTPEERI